jgi:hypothetical protein
MPCKDVTELLDVILDENECLKDYAFSKRSCGQGIGTYALIIDQLKGRSLNELLFKTAEEFLTEFPIPDEVEEFLSLKHLFAIQGALEVYTGAESGGVNDAFAAAGIEYGDNESRIYGRISVDIVTEKIKSCGGCKGCGTASTKSKRKKSQPKSSPTPATV